MKGLEFELEVAEFTGEETLRAIENGSSLEVVHEYARRAAHHAGEVLGPYAAPWAHSRCTGQCGGAKGHPRHGKCDAGWPPNDAEGRVEYADPLPALRCFGGVSALDASAFAAEALERWYYFAPVMQPKVAEDVTEAAELNITVTPYS